MREFILFSLLIMSFRLAAEDAPQGVERHLRQFDYDYNIRIIREEFGDEVEAQCLDYIYEELSPMQDNREFFEDLLCRLKRKKAVQAAQEFKKSYDVESAFLNHKMIKFDRKNPQSYYQFSAEGIPVEALAMIERLKKDGEQIKRDESDDASNMARGSFRSLNRAMGAALINEAACLDPKRMNEEFKKKKEALVKAKNFYYGLSDNHCIPVLYTNGDTNNKVPDHQSFYSVAGSKRTYPKATDNKVANECPNDRADEFSGRGANERIASDKSKSASVRIWHAMKFAFQDNIYERHVVVKDQSKQRDWDALMCSENSCYGKGQNAGKRPIPNDISLDEYTGFLGRLANGKAMNENFEYNQSYQKAAQQGVVAMSDGLIKLAESLETAASCFEGVRSLNKASSPDSHLRKKAEVYGDMAKQYEKTDPALSKKFKDIADRASRTHEFTMSTDQIPVIGDCISLYDDMLNNLTEAVQIHAEGTTLAQGFEAFNRESRALTGAGADDAYKPEKVTDPTQPDSFIPIDGKFPFVTVKDGKGEVSQAAVAKKGLSIMKKINRIYSEYGDVQPKELQDILQPDLSTLKDAVWGFLKGRAHDELKEAKKRLAETTESVAGIKKLNGDLKSQIDQAEIEASKIKQALNALEDAWVDQIKLCNQMDLKKLKIAVDLKRLTNKKCQVDIPKDMEELYLYFEGLGPRKMPLFSSERDVKFPPLN